MSESNYDAFAFVAGRMRYYHELWRILGRSWTNLSTEAEWAVDNIPGDRHGELKIELTEAQRQAMLPVLVAMGLFDATDVPPGVYAEIVISGAKYGGMVGRLKEIRRLLEANRYRFGRITCLFGVRPREDKLDGMLEEIVDGLPPMVRARKWVREQLHLEMPFATEFELGILGWLVAYNGVASFWSQVGSADTTHLPDVPLRTVESARLLLPDATMTLVQVLNCPAVERPRGPARPTTDSSMAYWLEQHPPVRHAKIVVVFGPPHWRRQAATTADRIGKVRPDITLVASSRATAPDDYERLLPNALAEAVWLLKRAANEE